MSELLIQRAVQYCRLMRVDKPVGSLLLLWPTLWALWLAGEGRPKALHVAIFVAGVFVMRAAGCVINDFADRNFDAQVKRTKDRPLATGSVSIVEALGLFGVLLIVALLLVSQLNNLVIVYAFIGAVLAIIYPFLKRFTHLPQAWLGIAFGWGIPMAYAAELNAVPVQAWWLLAANISWALAYDTEYAMVDRDDDLHAGIKSTAILFGRQDLAMVAAFHFITLALLCYVATLYDLSHWFYWGIVLAALTMFWQLVLIKNRERQACFQAFLNNIWTGAAIFCGIVLTYLA